EIVDELVAFENHHLEVAVLAAAEIRLDDAAGAGGLAADRLRPPPGQPHVRVVMPPVRQLASLQRNDLEVLVVVRPEVSLDHPGWAALAAVDAESIRRNTERALVDVVDMRKRRIELKTDAQARIRIACKGDAVECDLRVATNLVVGVRIAE